VGLQTDSEPQATSDYCKGADNPQSGSSVLKELEDNRSVGDWKSRFYLRAWCQISIELLYLVALLILGSLALLDAALISPNANDIQGTYVSPLLGVKIKSFALKWIALWIAGLLGGTVFDLKWLYHSVAKGLWHCDRFLWRLIVPFNSATVALFTGFLVSSGAVPFLRSEAFDSALPNLAFGFVFGYFSDNILAALQNFAKKIFGTLG
jgi:hypothetical protein